MDGWMDDRHRQTEQNRHAIGGVWPDFHIITTFRHRVSEWKWIHVCMNMILNAHRICYINIIMSLSHHCLTLCNQYPKQIHTNSHRPSQCFELWNAMTQSRKSEDANVCKLQAHQICYHMITYPENYETWGSFNSSVSSEIWVFFASWVICMCVWLYHMWMAWDHKLAACVVDSRACELRLLVLWVIRICLIALKKLKDYRDRCFGCGVFEFICNSEYVGDRRQSVMNTWSVR